MHEKVRDEKSCINRFVFFYFKVNLNNNTPLKSYFDTHQKSHLENPLNVTK